jgi:hypothetical protein
MTGSGYKAFWYMELYLLVRLAQCVGLLINDLLTLLVLPRTPANHAIFLFPAILTPTKQTFFCSLSGLRRRDARIAALESTTYSPHRTRTHRTHRTRTHAADSSSLARTGIAPHWLRLVIHALSGASYLLVLAYQLALALCLSAVWVGYVETHWADLSWLQFIFGSVGWLLAYPSALLVCSLQNRLCTPVCVCVCKYIYMCACGVCRATNSATRAQSASGCRCTSPASCGPGFTAGCGVPLVPRCVSPCR